jgi:hypothetical protein
MELETSIFPIAIEKLILSYLGITLTEITKTEHLSSMWIFKLIKGNLENDEINEICDNVFFQQICSLGNLQLVEYVATNFNVSETCVYEGFMNACAKGHLSVAQYIHSRYSFQNFTNKQVLKTLEFSQLSHHTNVELWIKQQFCGHGNLSTFARLFQYIKYGF